MYARFFNLWLLLCISSFCLPVIAAAVPAVLPRPDKTPPATDKPIKVYILAGQSNMVGFGTLKDAKIITSRETVKLLSSVRLGVDLGVVSDVTSEALNELLLVTQPAHLQKISGSEFDVYERDVKRADLVREKLGGTK